MTSPHQRADEGAAVPIDVQAVRSTGWWMKRLFAQLGQQKRQRRLNLLYDYHRGRAPLPVGAEAAREAFEAFCRQARSNFAELVVAAASERMTPVGFRTALDGDETGDAEVGAVWKRAGLKVESADVHDLMLALGEAYVIVGEVDAEIGAPVITGEDPRYMIAEVDPANRRRLRAALKVLHDDVDGVDRAYLFLPGSATESGRAEIKVAYRRSSMAWSNNARGPRLDFNPRSWSWDPERSGELAHDRIPVVRFVNKYHLGEFEPHVDLLDRINQQILARMVVATMQAFRQRAVRGLPLEDEHGNEIDYSDVFTADPAALWQLPATAEMWESGQIDLTPILSAVRDDVQHLGAVTRTPLYLLQPAGENQSAEGATNQREGLVFKVRDRIDRTSHPWAQVMSLALLQMGDPQRADLSRLDTLWAPPEHLSLAERASAASQAANDIPRRSRLIHIWGFTPTEADRIMSEWDADALLAAQVTAAAATAAGQSATPPEGSGTVSPRQGETTGDSHRRGETAGTATAAR